MIEIGKTYTVKANRSTGLDKKTEYLYPDNNRAESIMGVSGDDWEVIDIKVAFNGLSYAIKSGGGGVRVDCLVNLDGTPIVTEASYQIW